MTIMETVMNSPTATIVGAVIGGIIVKLTMCRRRRGMGGF
jgi:hypothetical protein